MPFTFKRLDIPDIILAESRSFPDDRGYFLESFKESDFAKNGIDKKFVQDNFSHSYRNVIRGLHFQNMPKAQAKVVFVTKGEIFDVAVDLRKKSPTFGRWVGQNLSQNNRQLLYIPEGFAHGFCVLSNEADVFYKVSNEYSAEHDSGVLWNDPEINITWPTKNPIISKKDLDLPLLKDADIFF